jgi:hypothetical protein
MPTSINGRRSFFGDFTAWPSKNASSTIGLTYGSGRLEMEVAAYVEFMLSIMAIALSVLVAGITLLGLYEAVEWATGRKRTSSSVASASYDRGNAWN